MTTLARLLHLDDGEFPALRAQIEAKPIPVQVPRKPLGWGPAMLAYLRALDVAAEPNIAPIMLTDWSARLADAFKPIDASLAFKAQAFHAHLDQVGADYVMAVKVLTGAQIADAGILAAEAKALGGKLAESEAGR